jgi:hypothetical protein
MRVTIRAYHRRKLSQQKRTLVLTLGRIHSRGMDHIDVCRDGQARALIMGLGRFFQSTSDLSAQDWGLAAGPVTVGQWPIMKLVRNKSYTWIFVVVFAVFVVLGMILPVVGIYTQAYAMLTIAIALGCIIALEIKSGIALDFWWRAEYGKRTWQYNAMLAWQSLALVVWLVVCYWGWTKGTGAYFSG